MSILKKIVLITFIIAGFSSRVLSQEPFLIDLDYASNRNTLNISFQRLSKDEVQHSLKELQIFLNEKSVVQEDLKTRNYLNEIKMSILLKAGGGDEIKVVIVYGKDENEQEKVIVVEEKIVDLESLDDPMNNQASILIRGDGKSFSSGEDRNGDIKSYTFDKKKIYGYERDDSRDFPSYGYKDFGYEGDKNSYGRDMYDN